MVLRTYEARPLSALHSARAAAASSLAEECSCLLVYRSKLDGSVVCVEAADGGAFEGATVMDARAELVVLEGVDVARMDPQLLARVKDVVCGAYDSVHEGGGWWLKEQDGYVPVAELLPGPAARAALQDLKPLLTAIREWRVGGGYGDCRELPMPLWLELVDEDVTKAMALILPAPVFESLRQAAPAGGGSSAQVRRMLQAEAEQVTGIGRWESEHLKRKRRSALSVLGLAVREGIRVGRVIGRRLAQLNPVLVAEQEGGVTTAKAYVRWDGGWINGGRGRMDKVRRVQAVHLRAKSGCVGPACEARRPCAVCRLCIHEHCICHHPRDSQLLGLPSRLLPEVGPHRRYHDGVVCERVHQYVPDAGSEERGPWAAARYPGGPGPREEDGSGQLVRELSMVQVECALELAVQEPGVDEALLPPRGLLHTIEEMAAEKGGGVGEEVRGSLGESALIALGVVVEECVNNMVQGLVQRAGGARGRLDRRGLRDFDVLDATRTVAIHVGTDPEKAEEIGEVIGRVFGEEQKEERVEAVVKRLRWYRQVTGRGAPAQEGDDDQQQQQQQEEEDNQQEEGGDDDDDYDDEEEDEGEEAESGMDVSTDQQQHSEAAPSSTAVSGSEGGDDWMGVDGDF